ncbi:MAG: HNH endonuclease [Culicoidibacterales bacterium]
MVSEYTKTIHQIARALPRISMPVKQEITTQAGILFLFDHCERYYDMERIVYIGYSGNMSRRWRQVFYGKTQSNIRGYLQQLKVTEAEIEAYMQDHFQFAILECPNEYVAKRYAQQICALFQADENFQPTPQWLGRHVQTPPLAETKLWQTFAPQSLERNEGELHAVIELLAASQVDEVMPVTDHTLDLTTLQQIANQAPPFAQARVRIRKEWQRNPHVRAYTLKQAAGRCQLCEQPAPFRLADGTPFLEVHHVIPLEAGGPDTIANCVALCPNCHREVHYAPHSDHEEYLKSQQNVTKD